MGKYKSKEIRMRNTLKRRGYMLKKSGRRDPLALDYGKYWITSSEGSVYFGGENGVSLEEIIEYVEEQENFIDMTKNEKAIKEAMDMIKEADKLKARYEKLKKSGIELPEDLKRFFGD